ncbi:sensor histidine kinase [Pseudomonas purpurea]|uniref:sensor histidine kinase n=1 Tax=Pseudomonas purpurea TaxID=3136737 RepID=UPI0032657FB2
MKILLLLLTLCLGQFHLQAQADVLHLSRLEQPVSARGYLQRLDDPKGTLTPEQAAQATTWRALPGSLSAGYTTDAVWLRIEVQAIDTAEQNWVLRLNNALLDDVRLYQYVLGAWQEQRAGEDLPRSQWPENSRAAVFPLQPHHDQPQLLLLRLQTKNALSVSIELTPRLAFSESNRREFLMYGLYFGVYLMLIGFHSIFWRMTRAPESGWYLSYVSCCVLVEALTIGLPQQFLGIPVWVSDPLLGVALALGVPIGVIFAGRQLGLPEVYPRLQRGLAWLCWGIGGGAALTVIAGHYREAMPVVLTTALLLVPCFIGLGVWLLCRGHRPARFYLLAFGIYYAGVVISFLRNLGYVPAMFWTDHAVAIGTLIHMGLMSLRIITHYNRLKRDKELAQAAAAEMTLQQSAHLESLVAIRTQELSQEILRRALLEQELRVALEHEQRIQAQQNDFVAMVSHEFRTPLAIISTSAQQLAKHLDAPAEKNLRRCQNIRNAGSRLLALVDDYLTHDRMTDLRPTARLAPCDLALLLENVVAEFAPWRISLDYRLPHRLYLCDAGLLHVAVRNLLANADRHTPAPTRIIFTVNEIDDALSLSIRHPGEAIPEDERERLFHKYYRGRQAQLSAGAGLGLYMVQRIAQLHGGDVQLVGIGGHEDVSFLMQVRLAQVPTMTVKPCA